MQPGPYSVYSRGEMRLMRRWQQLKDSFLAPVANAAERLNISADMISAAGALIVLFGAFSAVRAGDPKLFLWALWIHVILDGLDGTVARKTDHIVPGSLMDAASDFVGIIATIVILAVFTPIPGLLLLGVLVLWGLVLVLAIRRNHIGNPYHWLIRPRLPLYLLVTIDLIYGTAFSYLLLIAALGIFGFTAITGLGNLKTKVQPSSAPSK